MSKFRIHTLWGWRKNADGPELMVAWDEWCAEENWRGYEEDKQRAVESWGSDLLVAREIGIDVDYDLVLRAFESPVIGASVVTNNEA